MKTIMKSLIAAGLLLAATAASAQSVKLEERMNDLINEYSEELCTNKTVNETRDPAKAGRPLKSKCEIYYFTIKKKKMDQRELLQEMLRAMETIGREDPNCYSVNSMNGRENGDASRRQLMIGENTENYIEIGKDYDNYWNVNAIDTADATKSHRYAYAVEWSEKGNKIDLRYIVTYAKIPSATSTIIRQDWPYLEIGPSRIPNDGPIQAPNKARVFYLGKEYSVQQLDSVIDEAQKREAETFKKVKEDMKREAETYKKVKEEIQRETEAVKQMRAFVVWTDSLHHDTDPVTAVVLNLQQGKNITADDLLCNDNILLIFAQLKKQYLAGQNTEFNAISIYNLCKQAHEYGFFTGKYSKEELKQLKREIASLIDKTPEIDEGTNVQQRIYLGLALSHLEKIE